MDSFERFFISGNLSVGVGEMQRALRRLGYPIPETDLQVGDVGSVIRRVVRDFQRSVGLKPTGQVDVATFEAMKESLAAQRCAVRGTVRAADGAPLPHTSVVALDRRLRSTRRLGSSQTRLDGTYEITYATLAPAGDGLMIPEEINLVVQVLDAEGKVVTESSTLFNAPPLAVADVMIGGGTFRGASELEMLSRAIMPLLDGVRITDLGSQDLVYMARATKTAPSRIDRLVKATKLSEAAGVPVAVSYALIRANLPSDPASLYIVGRDIQRKAIERAISDGIVSLPSGTIDAYLDTLRIATVDAALSPDPLGRGTLGTLLATTRATRDQQRQFLMAYAQHDGTPETFWASLAAKSEFADPALIADLQSTLQIGALTLNHPPLVAELKRRMDQGQIASFRDLAKYSIADWKAMVAAVGVPPDIPGTTPDERATTYAETLAQIVEDSYPTDVIRYRLRDSDVPDREVVTTFLEHNPDFDLGSSVIDTHVTQANETHTVRAMKETVSVLKAYQRVFRLTPRFAEMRALLRDGVHSAMQVTQMGRATFATRYQEAFGDRARAEQAYNRAVHITSTAVHLFANYNAKFRAATPAAVPQFQTGGAAIAAIPDWETLFGSLDMCECVDCRSVLSPAAYFVDLLHFLSQRPSQPYPTGLALTASTTGGSLATGTVYVRVTALDSSGRETSASAESIVAVTGPTASVQATWTPIAGASYRIYVGTSPGGENSYFTSSVPSYAITTLSGTVGLPSAGVFAKDVLFHRRGDLGQIELTCENTNTPVPYVDLVNEILEDAVAPRAFSISPTLAADLNGGTVTGALKLAFATANYPLTDGAVVTIITAGSAWIIRDRGWRFVIQQGGGHITVSPFPQTGGTADEVAANPEHLNDGAYDKLGTAVYPWILPLDLWEETARTYLGRLGTTRADLITALRGYPTGLALTASITGGSLTTGTVYVKVSALNSSGTETLASAESSVTVTGSNASVKATWTPIAGATYRIYVGTFAGGESTYFTSGVTSYIITTLTGTAGSPPPTAALAIGSETLSLTTLERQIITGTSTHAVPDFWGFPPPVNLSWVEIVSHVREFLKRSGLQYSDLLALLATQYVNPNSQLTIISTDPSDPLTCDTARLQIGNLTADALDRIHRFVRLSQKLGWSFSDVDAAMMAFEPLFANVDGTFREETFVLVFATLVRLLKTLRLPVVLLLTLWRSIPTGASTPAAPSLYAQLFQNEQVLKPVDPAFALNASGTELAIVSNDPANAKISKHTATILAGTGISATDLAAITTLDIASDALTLANLSEIYRIALLAHALNLSVSDLLRLKLLSGINPFDPAYPEATLSFCRLADEIRGAVFSLDQIDYIVRDQTGPSPTLAINDIAVAAILDDLYRGLVKISLPDAANPPSDPVGQQTRVALAKLASWTDEMVTTAMAIIAGTSAESPVTQDAFIDANFGVFVNTSDAKQKLVDGPAGIFVDGAGRIHVADSGNGRIVRMDDMTGAGWTALGTPGSGINQFDRPAGILVDGAGRIYVADHGNGRLVRMNDMTGAGWTTLGTPGSGVNQFDGPAGIFVDAAGRIYVADWNNGRLVRMNDMTGAGWTTLGTPGGRVNQFDGPAGLFVDGSGRIYVADRFNHCIVRMDDMTGAGWTTLGTPGSGVHQFEFPAGIFLDGAGKIYVGDHGNGRIVRMNDMTGAGWTTQGAPGSGVNQFDGLGLLTRLESRYSYALYNLQLSSAIAARRHLIATKLAAVLTVDPKTTILLLTSVSSVATPGAYLIDDFLALAAIVKPDPNVPLTPAQCPTQIMAYQVLVKITLVSSRLKMRSDDLTWYVAYAKAAGWLDFSDLPTTPQAAANGRFDRLRRTVELRQLRDSLPGRGETLGAIFAIAHDPTKTMADAIAELTKRTGWSIDDLGAVTDTSALALALTDFQDERGLARIYTAMAMLKRLGTSVPQAVSWTKADLTSDDARAIVQAVRAKYDPGSWPATAKALRDVLRERQREALVEYLRVRPDTTKNQEWIDSYGIYQYYLIDVDMTPCQMTSRIKQAIGSVQLFFQRARMNLEPGIVADVTTDIEWANWTWMKHYRVWEANRRIFLFPEDWIDPELRDDKSPLFRDLENELLKNDITDSRAADAYIKYLEGLNEISRLEVVAMYHERTLDQQGNPVVDIEHVVGRSPARAPSPPPSPGSTPGPAPHKYYYRQRVGGSAGTARWTAWEKIPVDIEGDHLIPLVSGGRLTLYWPIFTQKGVNQSVVMPNPGDPLDKQQVYWEIKIASSEYHNKAWSAKRVSAQALTFPTPPATVPPVTVTIDDLQTTYARKYFSFRGVTVDDLAIVLCFFESKAGSYQVEYDLTFFGAFMTDHCHGQTIAYPFPDPKPVPAPPDLPPWHTGIDYMHYAIEPFEVAVGVFEFALILDYEFVLLGPVSPSPDFSPDFAGPQQDLIFRRDHDFFYQDFSHAFYVIPHKYGIYANGKRKGVDRPARVNPRTVDLVRGAYYEKPRASGLQIALEQFARTQLAFPSAVSAQAITDRSETSNAPGNGRTAEMGLPMDRMPVASTDPEIGSYTPLYSLYFYNFQEFFHPYVCSFISALYSGGTDQLLTRAIQLQANDYFKQSYIPYYVNLPYPIDDVNFSYGGAYASYNWELFFHIPLLIATKLMTNKRFEEAQKWFHYIFNPTDATTTDSAPQRYWITRPFYKASASDYAKQQIEELLTLIDQNSTDPDLVAQVREWQNNPFDPFTIARLRTVAFQKATVMKYLDNLIAWGDQLFAQDTIETINEATQLYVLAAEILGPRPVFCPPRADIPVETYDSLEAKLDAFSNELVPIENLVPPNALPAPSTSGSPVTLPSLFYFCIPANDKLLSYWDTVADRLYKVRHCLNLRGVFQQLPLFEPAIDPKLLVQAAAAGVDLGSILADLNAPSPLYRFSTMLQKAKELVTDVRGLGASLLAALEKGDAESLALVRSSDELTLLQAMRTAKSKAVQEAQGRYDALLKTQAAIQLRHDYYAGLEYINVGEAAHLAALAVSGILEGVQGDMKVVAAVLHLVPEIKLGTPTTLGATVGGENVSGVVEGIAQSLGHAAQVASIIGNAAQTLASYGRRYTEWQFQANLASADLGQIAQEIAAADLRRQIAEEDLNNHDIQTQNAQDADSFLRSKFTSSDLYGWMTSQLVAIYNRGYQQAFDAAKRAEAAFRYELGIMDSRYIQFGYWDSLKQGLLAGERLTNDLRALELAYHEQNQRQFEITKYISLLMLAPEQLVNLRETGTCGIELPEWLYDLDYPGHYMRRIKTVSVTIPCVTGPYTSVNATLTLNTDHTRLTADLPGGHYQPQPSDSRFKDNYASVQAIVTSTAQNDSGMFELNFHDERLLWFEGAGAWSTWTLDLPIETNAFNRESISDVIIKVQYTARDGGQALRTAAQQANPKPPDGDLIRLLDAARDFPTDWYRFGHPTDPMATTATLTLPIGPERFPFLYRNRLSGVVHVALLARPADGVDASTLVGDTFTLTAPDGSFAPLTLQAAGTYPLPFAESGIACTKVYGHWTLMITTATDLTTFLSTFGDLLLLLRYTVNP